MTISSDLVTKASFPKDLQGPLRLFTGAKVQGEHYEADDVQEFVVEFVFAHAKDDADKSIARIRWHGIDSAADTWKPTKDIQPHFVKWFCIKKEIPMISLLRKSLATTL